MAFSAFIVRSALITIPWKTTKNKPLLELLFALTDSDSLTKKIICVLHSACAFKTTCSRETCFKWEAKHFAAVVWNYGRLSSYLRAAGVIFECAVNTSNCQRWGGELGILRPQERACVCVRRHSQSAAALRPGNIYWLSRDLREECKTAVSLQGFALFGEYPSHCWGLCSSLHLLSIKSRTQSYAFGVLAFLWGVCLGSMRLRWFHAKNRPFVWRLCLLENKQATVCPLSSFTVPHTAIRTFSLLFLGFLPSKVYFIAC